MNEKSDRWDHMCMSINVAVSIIHYVSLPRFRSSNGMKPLLIPVSYINRIVELNDNRIDDPYC